MGDALPVRQPARRIPFHQRKEVERETAEMLRKNVESRSAWQGPISLVKKLDGSITFLIDFRGWNAVSKLAGGAVPLITETLDALNGSELFRSIELASGYWQMEMAEKDREKTEFLTHEGLFEFTVLALWAADFSRAFVSTEYGKDP